MPEAVEETAAHLSIVKEKKETSDAFEAGSWPRFFTREGVHPFDEVKWKKVDAVLKNVKGEIKFEQKDVEVPDWWNQNSINIVASKYMRVIKGVKENSVKQVFKRVADTLTTWANDQGYFNTNEDADVYKHELIYVLLHQFGAFNSPVWFNLGVPDRKQAASACFISQVDDTLRSISNFQESELKIFSGGSGSGANSMKTPER
jgi:ribonucleoside-diphosphate reductase alpha chain